MRPSAAGMRAEGGATRASGHAARWAQGGACRAQSAAGAVSASGGERREAGTPTLFSSFSRRTPWWPGSSETRQRRRKSPLVASKSGRVPSCRRRHGLMLFILASMRGMLACTQLWPAQPAPADGQRCPAAAPCFGNGGVLCCRGWRSRGSTACRRRAAPGGRCNRRSAPHLIGDEGHLRGRIGVLEGQRRVRVDRAPLLIHCGQGRAAGGARRQPSRPPPAAAACLLCATNATEEST